MICIKAEFIGENRETLEKLINLLNKAVHNFCVEHAQAFVIYNDVKVITVATKVIP